LLNTFLDFKFYYHEQESFLAGLRYFFTCIFRYFVSKERRKNNLETSTISVNHTQTSKWDDYDKGYVTYLRQFTSNYHGISNGRISTICIASGSDSTYGWFSDPDSCLIEGPYVSAKNSAIEDSAATCPDYLALVDTATAYLTNEGYSDIVTWYHRQPASVVQAANALLEMKYQMIIPLDRLAPSHAKFWNCVFQALGFTTLAALGSDWATASRTEIIRRVGKLILKHVGIIGAIIAVVDFIDCITD
jgi:hypothetical protein